MKEKWKPVEGFDGYLVSNKGRVKSVDRTVRQGERYLRVVGRILVPMLEKGRGYLRVSLRLNSRTKTFRIHLLVWDAFGNEKRNGQIKQVDHKDDNKWNNWITNLQLLDNRGNCHKRIKKNKTSKYIGVSLCSDGRYSAQIYYNKKAYNLGRYTTEIQARRVYLKRLKAIKNEGIG